MKCEHIKELLSPYMDNMTSNKENMQIDAHLLECPECRRELDYLKLLSGALGELEHPQLPEQFTDDLHKRLLEEKTQLFSAKEIRRPKRSGWIAAGLATVALTVGIYASSILPLGNIIASFDKEPVQEKERPKVAIEDIIRSIKGWGHENEVAPQVDIADNHISEGDTNTPAKIEGNSEAVAPNPESEITPPPVLPKFTDGYVTKVRVADAGPVVDQVTQIAKDNKIEYKLMPYTSNIQALSVGNSKELYLKVNKNESKALLKQLGEVAQITTPLPNQVEITKEYAQVEEQIFITENIIKKLESQAKPTETEAKQLQELKEHLNQNNKKKADLDRELNMVTIRIIVEEEVKH